MSQWFTLLQKELLEMTRNFKWIWVPITFILLGVMDPLSTYYLPQILDSVGGLPEGTVIEIPTPSAAEILMMSIGQYNMLGLLIIVLTSMGIIANERKSGVAGLILVKPVKYSSYITAKWTGALILLWVSYFIGFLVSWYYVGILFDWVPFTDFIKSFFAFGIWLSLVLTITLFFNAFFQSPGVVGFISLGVVIVLNLVSSMLSHLMEWSPAQISSYIGTFLMTNSFPDEMLPAIIVTFISMILLVVGSIYVFQRKELAS
ncbi:ABC transporter permease [Cytobacillus sp. FJAT-54145]|uniref:ABC transporter permease n=1 Tax=Cytobacillus spartinae TaxID=3299023 RepID=A0ABW6KCP9_9BACI